MKRRDMLAGGLAALAGWTRSAALKAGWEDEKPKGGGIPLVHISDLYHPPQDPDDHIDLATVAALPEYDLKGVILDSTRRFLLAFPAGVDIRRDPGFIPVIQLGFLLGRPIPVAAGPTIPLRGTDDSLADRLPREQAGVRLLQEILEESRERVTVSVVGSARTLTALFNRSPGLVRSKVRCVLLNAGTTSGPKQEWNVALDPEAYVGLWKSGLPIHWYPCATEQGAFNPDHEHGTYWKTTHAEIFRDLAPELRAWFSYALSPGRDNMIIAALAEAESPGTWARILSDKRNMWSTASLVMGAGRVLAKTPQGWRFVPSSSATPEMCWPWRLDRIEAHVREGTEVQWRPAAGTGNAWLFTRQMGPRFSGAMSEALGALLGSLSFSA